MSENVYSFQSISNTGQFELTEKGSKFIGIAVPVENMEDINQCLANIRKDHSKARHICYAYSLGSESSTTKIHDDGEPSGTAGKPILGQIHSAEITNVLAVVVRYFGGILLGTGGLIKAYKQAAKGAIESAGIKTVIQHITISVSGQPGLISLVASLIKERHYKISHLNLNESANVIFSIPTSEKQELLQRIKSKILRLPLHKIEQHQDIPELTIREIQN